MSKPGRKPTYAHLAKLLLSTRNIAALHMRGRGFTEVQIAESFPGTDEALRKLGFTP